MELEAQDRRALFGVSLPSHQLQKFLIKQKDYKASKQEVREVFSDLSKGTYMSMIIQAKTKGIIVENEDSFELKVDKFSAKTAAGDIIWRDIRILKVFTRKEVELDTGLGNETVRWYMRKFLEQGLIKANTMAKGKERTYTLISNEILRPIPNTKRKEVLADQVFKVAKKLGQFTQSSLIKELSKQQLNVSKPYVRQLIYQWSKTGNITQAFERGNRNIEITYLFVGVQRPMVDK